METLPETAPSHPVEDEWLWGWDSTPGIVSIWAENDGRVTLWRRLPATGELVREQDRFRPWVLLDRIPQVAGVTYRELAGPGALRYLVSADNYKILNSAIPEGAQRLVLPPDEQYLAATGRNYFRDLSFDPL